MSELLLAFAKDQSGATSIEYAFLLLVMSLMTYSAYSLVGDWVTASFSNTTVKLNEAASKLPIDGLR